MRGILNRLLSLYFDWAIVFDVIFVVVSCTAVGYLGLVEFIVVHNEGNWILNRLESLVSMNVSLAGFVLAALTIIVAIKSNLDSKPVITEGRCHYPTSEEYGIEMASTAESPMKLIFSSHHYSSIVRVYRKSISEFILSLIFCHVVIAIHEYIHLKYVYLLVTAIAFLTIVALIRSIVVLFRILDLED
jgi:hypothetical protein